jgi:hypothetical protein
LADLIGCKDVNKFLSWYKDCVKFELLYEDKTHFYSKVLIKNMVRWESSKSNGSKGGRPPKPKEEPKKKPKLNPIDNLDETIIEENSIEDNSKVPSIDVFLDYVKTVDSKFAEIEKSAILKYHAWKNNNWKDGNDKVIKNWKTKILNTIPHLKREIINYGGGLQGTF